MGILTTLPLDFKVLFFSKFRFHDFLFKKDN
jgi:hypothetical protein